MFKNLQEMLRFAENHGHKSIKIKSTLKTPDGESAGLSGRSPISAVLAGRVEAWKQAELGKEGKDVTLSLPATEDELGKDTQGDKISRYLAASMFCAHRGLPAPFEADDTTEETVVPEKTAKRGKGAPANGVPVNG